MNILYKSIFLFLVFVIFTGCSSKGFFSPCIVTGGEFSQSGLTGISLRFDYTGACDFRINKISPVEWYVEIPKGDFNDFTPNFDEFSQSKILSTRYKLGRFFIYFNKDTDVQIKKEGFKKVFILRENKVDNYSIGNKVTSVLCLNEPSYLFQINGNGILPYGYGFLGKNIFYTDIYGVNIDENFILPTECNNILSLSQVDYPKRLRIVVKNIDISNFKSATQSSSIIISKKNINSEKYILKINESSKNNVQSIKVYTSSKVTPKISEDSNGINIKFNEKVLFSKDLPKTITLKKGGISKIAIDNSTLKINSNNKNINVYIEETYYGFNIYAKSK